MSTSNQGRKKSTSNQGWKLASADRGRKQATSGGLVDQPPGTEGVSDGRWSDWYKRSIQGAEGERLSPKALPTQLGLHRQDGRPSAKFTTPCMVKTHPHAILPQRLSRPTIPELSLRH